MTIQLRCLLVRAQTDKGWFGRRLDLGNGLCVVHGPNAAGKSQLMQAIIYALGLEGMFGPAHGPPFAHALTDWLFTSSDNTARASVFTSEVMLQLENDRGEHLTLLRGVKGVVSDKLVRVAQQPVLTDRVVAPVWREFYVREGGAYQTGRGFHRYLPAFIGWTLPDVQMHSGEPKPLYMECIFPLLYVEQKHAWGHIAGRFPGYLGVKDAARRSVEFLLGLDVFDLGRQKIGLVAELESIRRRWTEAYAELRTRAAGLAVQLEGVPSAPQSGWKAVEHLKAFCRRGNGWTSVSEELIYLGEELTHLYAAETPTVSTVALTVQQSLSEEETRLRDLENESGATLRRMSVEEGTLQSITARLAALAEDHEQYSDYRKLKRLGSQLDLATSHDACPTCTQELPDSLVVNLDKSVQIMSVDENLAHLKAQEQLFHGLKKSSEEKVRELDQHLEQMRSAAFETRARIRSLKRTLITDDRAPSEATIARRLQLERTTEALKSFQDFVDVAVARLERIGHDFADVTAAYQALPKSGLSDSDKDKIAEFEARFVDQAGEYGLKSLTPRDLQIDRDSYRPSYQNYDLQFDLSASDAIRATWAYLVGLLEVARTCRTNHPGILILDEPRQQSAEIGSLRSLLRRLANAGQHGQQVIVATSEDISELRASLAGSQHTLVELGDRALKSMKGEFG